MKVDQPVQEYHGISVFQKVLGRSRAARAGREIINEPNSLVFQGNGCASRLRPNKKKQCYYRRSVRNIENLAMEIWQWRSGMEMTGKTHRYQHDAPIRMKLEEFFHPSRMLIEARRRIVFPEVIFRLCNAAGCRRTWWGWLWHAWETQSSGGCGHGRYFWLKYVSVVYVHILCQIGIEMINRRADSGTNFITYDCFTTTQVHMVHGSE